MDDYEEYLERYCFKHGISKEEAETHLTVKEVKQMYLNKESELA